MAILLVTLAIEVQDLDADDDVFDDGLTLEDILRPDEYDPVDIGELVADFLSVEGSGDEILAGSNVLVNIGNAELRSAVWEQP